MDTDTIVETDSDNNVAVAVKYVAVIMLLGAGTSMAVKKVKSIRANRKARKAIEEN